MIGVRWQEEVEIDEEVRALILQELRKKFPGNQEIDERDQEELISSSLTLKDVGSHQIRVTINLVGQPRRSFVYHRLSERLQEHIPAY